MPTYDYECQACGHSFEKFQPITSKPSRKCPSCAKLKAKRLIGTGAGIIFKGSGFYQTDYRSASYKEAAKKDTPDTKDAKEAGSSKAEDKSADKSPAKPADKSSTKSDATSGASKKK